MLDSHDVRIVNNHGGNVSVAINMATPGDGLRDGKDQRRLLEVLLRLVNDESGEDEYSIEDIAKAMEQAGIASPAGEDYDAVLKAILKTLQEMSHDHGASPEV